VERALVSVYDKSGLLILRGNSRRSASRSFRLGHGAVLREDGITVRDVSDLTGWPEMLGGRVKTLHRKFMAEYCSPRDAGDRQQTAEHNIAPIDLVVVNLYPFETTARSRTSRLWI